jgi:putative flippase GtrA
MNFVTNTIEKMAAALGFEEVYRTHGHHIPRMLRVIIIGAIGALWMAASFETLGIWLDLMAPSTATLLGGEVAVISNFVLNERFNFNESEHSSSLLRRLVKFHLVQGISLVALYSILLIAEHLSRGALFLNAAFIFGMGIQFIINYTGYYFFVWRKQGARQEQQV